MHTMDRGGQPDVGGKSVEGTTGKDETVGGNVCVLTKNQTNGTLSYRLSLLVSFQSTCRAEGWAVSSEPVALAFLDRRRGRDVQLGYLEDDATISAKRCRYRPTPIESSQYRAQAGRVELIG